MLTEHCLGARLPHTGGCGAKSKPWQNNLLTRQPQPARRTTELAACFKSTHHASSLQSKHSPTTARSSLQQGKRSRPH